MVTSNGRIPLSLEGIESALARSRTGDSEAFLESLRKRVRVYEQRYKMPSDVLRLALQEGKVGENLDVVKWLHAHETLVELENGSEARAPKTKSVSPRRAESGG